MQQRDHPFDTAAVGLNDLNGEEKMAVFRKKKNKFDVINIKNHTADTMLRVHIAAFAVFEVLVYIIGERWVFSKLLPPGIVSEILRAIVFAGAYALIFWGVKALFDKLIVKYRPRLNIDGTWYHVHIPERLDPSQRIPYLSAGKTVVSRELNDFTFSADNYRYTVRQDGTLSQISELPTTTWWTETSEVCDSNEYHIVEVYKARSEVNQTTDINSCPVCGRKFTAPKTVEQASQHRYGIHLYRIIDPMEEMVCSYSDCWPSLKSGNLFFFRTVEARDEKIRRFFAEQEERCAAAQTE